MGENRTHTPGPWSTAKDAVPDGFVQVTVYAEEDGERVATVFETEGNARLMAAVPDLLYAAQMALEDQYGREREGWDVAQGLIDAIAKATGQDS